MTQTAQAGGGVATLELRPHMFALKKLISTFLLPLPAALCLLAVALGFLWLNKRQRAAQVLVTVAFALLLLFSLPLIADALLDPVESGQEPLYPAARLVEATAGRNPRWLVVLGGGHVTEPRLPAVDQLSSSALTRLIEGVRLYRALPGMKMVLSGGVDPITPHAEVLANAAISLGVPAEDVVLERTTVDTEDEATKLARIVGADDFILVTSASHMPRAIALFRARGLDPIGAPTDYVVRHNAERNWHDFVIPNASALNRSAMAEHEYLGRLWSKFRGHL